MPSLGVSSLDLGRLERPLFFQQSPLFTVRRPMRFSQGVVRTRTSRSRFLSEGVEVLGLREFDAIIQLLILRAHQVGGFENSLDIGFGGDAGARIGPDRLSRLGSVGLKFVRRTHRLLRRGRVGFPGQAAALLGRFLPRLGPLAKTGGLFSFGGRKSGFGVG